MCVFLFPTVPNANPMVPEDPIDNAIPESTPSSPGRDPDKPGMPGNSGEH